MSSEKGPKYIYAQKHNVYLEWKWSSGWLEPWEGLLFVTDVSITCAEAIFRVKWSITWLWRWLPHRLSKCQSPTTVLLRTPVTQMITFNQGMLSLGSNHFRININCITVIITLDSTEKIKTEKKMTTKQYEESFFHQCCKKMATNTVMAFGFWLAAYIVQ